MVGKKDVKHCRKHLQIEYFPITYSFCPYCGQGLERTPADPKQERKGDLSSKVER